MDLTKKQILNTRRKNWRHFKYDLNPENDPALRRKHRRPGLFFGPVFRPQRGARKTNIYTTQQLYVSAEKSLKIALAH